MRSALVSYSGQNSIYTGQLLGSWQHSVYTGQVLWSQFCLHWSVIVVKILSTLVNNCSQNSVYTGQLLWSKFCLHWSVIVVKNMSTLVRKFDFTYLAIFLLFWFCSLTLFSHCGLTCHSSFTVVFWLCSLTLFSHCDLTCQSSFTLGANIAIITYTFVDYIS